MSALISNQNPLRSRHFINFSRLSSIIAAEDPGENQRKFALPTQFDEESDYELTLLKGTILPAPEVRPITKG